MKTGEINFDDVRKSSVHNDLFEALCLLKRARNLIHEVKTEEELIDFNSRLDQVQTDLNNQTAMISEAIGYVMYSRIDGLV